MPNVSCELVSLSLRTLTSSSVFSMLDRMRILHVIGISSPTALFSRKAWGLCFHWPPVWFRLGLIYFTTHRLAAESDGEDFDSWKQQGGFRKIEQFLFQFWMFVSPLKSSRFLRCPKSTPTPFFCHLEYLQSQPIGTFWSRQPLGSVDTANIFYFVLKSVYLCSSSQLDLNSWIFLYKMDYQTSHFKMLNRVIILLTTVKAKPWLLMIF